MGERWMIVCCALGIIFSSLVLQLSGHWVHEVFNAPPSLMHGFVSAPILEYISLLWRLGVESYNHKEVTHQVEEIRKGTFRLHRSLLLDRQGCCNRRKTS